MQEALMRGSYSPGLVCLSVLIAFCASYAALELASCTTASKGRVRTLWMTGGAIAMGIGIWAMHYVGMLAFRLPVPVLYNVPVVGLSLVTAIASAAIALFVVTRPSLTMPRLISGSLAMGTGIFAMHYIGMAAMRLPAHCLYNPWIVAASGLIAVMVSGAALQITFRLRHEVGQFRWVRLASAAIMGVAIAAMHYTGMAAACFRRSPMEDLSANNISISDVAAQGIIVVTLSILFLTILAVVAARYVSLQTELLRNTQAEHQLFMQHNLASVCRTSLDGRVLQANQMTLNTLGYQRAEDILGVKIQDHYWFPEDRHRIVSALKQRGVLNGIEVCLKRTDGKPVWVLYNLLLSKNANSRHSEIIATAMDITGMKKIQEDFRSAKEAAEAANQAKSQFLANMSHELRTPLHGILGMTTLALDSDLPDDARSCLEDAKMSANGLLKIINDVLDYSKIEDQPLTLGHESFSLQEMLDDSVRTFAASAELKRIHLTCNVQTPIPEHVLGDSGRVRQILLNLLGNAIKFTDHGGVVMSVDAAPAEEQQVALHIRISDTGVGIPSENLDSIFEAFVQADNSDTRRFGGTGLGLAICSQLAAAMKGKIWAESTLDVGSTFHLRLNLELPLPSKANLLAPAA
jgi:two-component system sensor histidine kinase/response regulator